MPLVSVRDNDALLDVADFDEAPPPPAAWTNGAARQSSIGHSREAGSSGYAQQYGHHHHQQQQYPPAYFGNEGGHHHGGGGYQEEEEVSVMTLDSALVDMAANYTHSHAAAHHGSFHSGSHHSGYNAPPPGSTGGGHHHHSYHRHHSGGGGGPPPSMPSSSYHRHHSQPTTLGRSDSGSSSSKFGEMIQNAMGDLASVTSTSLHTVRGEQQQHIRRKSGGSSSHSSDARNAAAATTTSIISHKTPSSDTADNNEAKKANEYTESLELQVAKLNFELATAQSQLDVFKFRVRRVSEERDAIKNQLLETEQENLELKKKLDDFERNALMGKLNATRSAGVNSRRSSNEQEFYTIEQNYQEGNGRERRDSGELTLPSGTKAMLKTAVHFSNANDSNEDFDYFPDNHPEQQQQHGGGGKTEKKGNYESDANSEDELKYNDAGTDYNARDYNVDTKEGRKIETQQQSQQQRRRGSNDDDKRQTMNGISNDRSTPMNETADWSQQKTGRKASVDETMGSSNISSDTYRRNSNDSRPTQEEQEGWGGRLVGVFRRDHHQQNIASMEGHINNDVAKPQTPRTNSQKRGFWGGGGGGIDQNKLDPRDGGNGTTTATTDALTEQFSNSTISESSFNGTNRSGGGLGRLFGGFGGNKDINNDNYDDEGTDADGCSVFWGERKNS